MSEIYIQGFSIMVETVQQIYRSTALFPRNIGLTISLPATCASCV